ncbi:hypothetical protein F4859DRAFT_528475 [Xylaria cf. heliscus]|nr:hypothetical protein F4859DRAFT_528475 [Xylaria cf. heliscus]
MSILCCCRNRQPSEKETKTEAIELPIHPPRARLSKTLSRSDTDMYLSSILASRGPSQFMNPAYHNIVDPEAVDVDDSDEDGPERDTRGLNIGTLGSLRTKLIRRLSHRADTKSRSRPSIGASDEELARRAELKRLMHKRIQEELKSEEEEEDLRIAPPRRPSINNSREPELSGGGPRDTIEFSVSNLDEQEIKNAVDTLPETTMSPTSIICGPQEPYPQRTSCSESARRSIDNSYHRYNQSINEREPSLRPLSSPHLTPVHLLGGSGRESPSTASWRLSYSAIHIESYIEPLVDARQVSCSQSPGPGSLSTKLEDDNTQTREADTTTNFSNPTMQDETVNTSQTMQFEHLAYPERNQKENDKSSNSIETSDGRYSPLDVWLRSQDLHCASILSSRPNSEMGLEQPHEPYVREKFECLQKPESSAELSSYKYQTANSSSILQEHTPGAWRDPSTYIADEEEPSLDTLNDESIVLRRVLNQIENALPIEDSTTENRAQDASSRYTSSRYTTRPNSRQATPGGSRASLTDIQGTRRITQSLSPIYGPASPHRVSDNSDISSYRTALNKTPSSDHAKPKIEASQFSTAKTLSTNASETASFRQREEELKSIKKRFGLTPARLSPMVPVHSKFREEFEDPKGSNSGKGSIFSKLHLALPKRAVASSSHTELSKSNEEIGLRPTAAPKSNKLQSFGPDSHTGRFLPSNIEKSTTVLQQGSTRRVAEPWPWRWKANIIKVSMSKPTINTTGPRPISVNSHYHGITKMHATKQERKNSDDNPSPHSKISNNLKMSNEAEPSDTVDIHAGVLQEWVEQLQAEDIQRQSRTESKVNVPKRQPRRLRTPPESWAKWPSHTREKRTALAGEKDKVKSWDFAVARNPNLPEIEAGDNMPLKDKELAMVSRTLSSHVGKVLKSGWHKMITHTGSLGRASESGITAPHRFLEYPELELLPTAAGYREVEALDQQIDTMKRRSTSRGRVTRKSSSDGARRPLASRIAEEVHKFQVEDENMAWTEIEHRAKVLPTARLLSPAHTLFTRRSKSCGPELIGTPEPQCTYGNCVQTQMLHDDDDKNTKKAIIKRAKSTGNIETKQSGDALPVNESASIDHGLTHKAHISGLRRHRSLGWLRGSRRSSDRTKPTVIKQD